MKPFIILALFQTSLISLSWAFQISEVSDFYLTQGVLGASTLVSFVAAVYLYRENKSLTLKLINIMERSLQQQNDMTKALEHLTKNLDIENTIREAIKESKSG